MVDDPNAALKEQFSTMDETIAGMLRMTNDMAEQVHLNGIERRRDHQSFRRLIWLTNGMVVVILLVSFFGFRMMWGK